MRISSLSLHPLPGSSSFVEGYYGLEECQVRGIVRLAQSPYDHLKPVYISKLTVQLTGATTTQFVDVMDSGDYTSRTKVMFETTEILLQETDLTAEEFAINGTWIDIPFETRFPHHDPISPGSGPCFEILPPSCSLTGTSTSRFQYEARVTYTLTATIETSLQPFAGHNKQNHNGGNFLLSLFSPNKKSCSTQILPFMVYDPRLLSLMLFPDIRRWRSAPGTAPVEYDIEVGPLVFGAGDTFRFAYRLLLHPDLAKRGVRIKRVTFHLKEYHLVGEGRCCVRDDDNQYHPGHPPPSRCKGVREILRWERNEYATFSSSGSALSPKSSKAKTPLRARPEDESPVEMIPRPNQYAKAWMAATDASRVSLRTSPPPSELSLAVAIENTLQVESIPPSHRQQQTQSQPQHHKRLRSISSSNLLSPPPRNPSHLRNRSISFHHHRNTQQDFSHVELVHRPGTRVGGGDGIYAEGETNLTIPTLGGFIPSTARIVIPADDYICRMKRPRPADLQIRHIIQIAIEFVNEEKFALESPCYLACVGKKEMEKLLDEDPEILPTLDYDKVVGIEQWVPEYEPRPSPASGHRFPSEWDDSSASPSRQADQGEIGTSFLSNTPMQAEPAQVQDDPDVILPASLPNPSLSMSLSTSMDTRAGTLPIRQGSRLVLLRDMNDARHRVTTSVSSSSSSWDDQRLDRDGFSAVDEDWGVSDSLHRRRIRTKQLEVNLNDVNHEDGTILSKTPDSPAPAYNDLFQQSIDHVIPRDAATVTTDIETTQPLNLESQLSTRLAEVVLPPQEITNVATDPLHTFLREPPTIATLEHALADAMNTALSERRK